MEKFNFPSRGCTKAAGWILVAAILGAPWAFGSRPYWAALSLAGALAGAAVLWTCGWVGEQRLPVVRPVCWCAVVFLALFAAISILNPRSNFDVALGTFVLDPAYVPFLPSTVDPRTGWSFTLEMVGYLLVIPAVADLAQSARWRHRFFGAMALTGVLVAAAGLCLKAGLLPRLHDYLQHRVWAQGEIFGPFDYHGNAGAFLNLALPAAAWNATTGRPVRRILSRCGVGILYLALFFNSSRAALVIGACLAPLCLFIMLAASEARLPVLAGERRRWKRAFAVMSAALVALALAGVLLATGDSKPMRRLRHLPAELREPEYPRYLQSRAAWEMARERPLFGAGIGSYKVLVQTSSIRRYFFAPAFHPGDAFTVLGHAHDDYLQTLAEWGGVGFAGWLILVAGAFVTLWRSWQTQIGKPAVLATAAALLSVYLHAIGDCPLQIPALQLYTALYLGLAWGSG